MEDLFKTAASFDVVNMLRRLRPHKPVSVPLNRVLPIRALALEGGRDAESTVSKILGSPFSSLLTFELDVPCNGCSACCRAGFEVTATPFDDETLFTGIGKKGQAILPIDETGRCQYLGNNGCTVYDRRPVGCSSYDCRINALSGCSSETAYGEELDAVISDWSLGSMIASERDIVELVAFRIAVVAAGAVHPEMDSEARHAKAILHFPNWVDLAKSVIDRVRAELSEADND